MDRNAEETQTASERLWPAVQRATLQAGALGGSTEAPSQDWLCNTNPCTPEPPGTAPRGSWPGGAQPGIHVSALVSRVCGKLSTNLPAVLNYLNVSKSSTFNVYKYILLQKKKKIVVYRPTTSIYVCVCVYTCKAVCVYVCAWVEIHTQTQTCIYMFFSLNTWNLATVLELKKKRKKTNKKPTKKSTQNNPKNRGGKKKRKTKKKKNLTGDLFCHHFGDFLFYLTACSVKPTFLVKNIYCFVDNKVCKKKEKKKRKHPKNQPPTIAEVASVVHLLLSWLCCCCSVCVWRL